VTMEYKMTLADVATAIEERRLVVPVTALESLALGGVLPGVERQPDGTFLARADALDDITGTFFAYNKTPVFKK